MTAKLIGMAIQLLLSVLTPDLIKEGINDGLSWIEKKVLGSASTVDDITVLPIVKVIRTALDIHETAPATPSGDSK